MRRWYIKLDDYGIGRDLYDELRAFCRQYAQKKHTIADVRGGFNDVTISGMPGGGQTGNPTERRALRAMQYQKDLDAIERALGRACAPGLIDAVRENVCEGRRYEDMPVPMGRAGFFDARRRFFYELAKELGKI